MIKSVAMIVVPNFSIFEFATAFEVFGIDRSDRGNGVPAFDFRVCAPEPGDVPLKSGLSMHVGLGLDAAADADLVVMAPYGRDEDVPESVLDALRAAHARGAWVMSICSGAFALARAGLLDGRRCTTHWHYSQELASRYPAVLVDENVLYVEDGRIITQRRHGRGDRCLPAPGPRWSSAPRWLPRIARDMVVPPHRDGGQAQYIDRPMPQCGSEPMEQLLQWMVRHLDEEHPVNELAARVHMSPRTFARRFRAETGATPAAWLNSPAGAARPGIAETTELSIDEIRGSPASGIPSCCGTILRRHWIRVRSPTAAPSGGTWPRRRANPGDSGSPRGRARRAGGADSSAAARAHSTRSRHGPVSSRSGRTARRRSARMLYMNRSG